jgi:hypothetical protein
LLPAVHLLGSISKHKFHVSCSWLCVCMNRAFVVQAHKFMAAVNTLHIM